METWTAEDILHNAIAGEADIPASEWKYFWSHVRHVHFAERQHLVCEGRKAPSIHYIISGLVRLYYNEDGRELVRGFDFEGRWVCAFDSILTGQPALFSVQALEPTRTLCFSGELFESLYARHACWDRVGRRILEVQLLRQADKERRFRIHDAEEHYRLLITRRSPLIDRVPLNQLASYLQITPETLSRIRARLRQETWQSAGAGSVA